MAGDAANCAIIGSPAILRSLRGHSCIARDLHHNFLTILHFHLKFQARIQAVPACLTALVRPVAAACLMLLSILPAAAQTLPAGVTQRTTGELLTRRPGGGPVRFDLAVADHVVSGDQVVYTVEIRNTTQHAIDGISAVTPVPEKMTYIAGSASGPGCEVDFSVDGGVNFDSPDHLTIQLPAGRSRPAVAADYTHIRWRLQFPLRGLATALARFRAVLR